MKAPKTLISPNIERGSHLKILAETAHYIVVWKPSGWHSAGDTSALGAVLAVSPSVGHVAGRGRGEWGLLHRLDRGTSGALVFAKSQEFFDFAFESLSQHLWKKVYLLRLDSRDSQVFLDQATNLVRTSESKQKIFDNSSEQDWSSVEVSMSLAHDPKNQKKMVWEDDPKIVMIRGRKPRLWATRSRLVLSRLPLVAVEIQTGVMHQIRSTVAGLGGRILGDRLYGPASSSRAQKRWESSYLRASAQTRASKADFEGTRGSPVEETAFYRRLFATEDAAGFRAEIRDDTALLMPPHGFALHARFVQIPRADGPLGEGVWAEPPLWLAGDSES